MEFDTSSPHVVVKDDGNVLELRVGERAAPLTPGNLLEQFVWPLHTSSFLSSIFKSRVLAIHGGGMGRLADLVDAHLFSLDLAALLQHSTSEKIFCWSKGVGPTIVSLQVSSPASALECYGAGASLCFRCVFACVPLSALDTSPVYAIMHHTL